ncbi:Ig-like domain-containing protein [Polycladidibacter hongkongensis]|uniref:Ig-like domain-containing protein n=1 Tax=Polycladidibacter hongkongensis TaxID=1647556 RepID=UPI000829E167|nr:Ig-like domain-containing protein [Pseudovibrio hongkongensis]
MSKSGRNWAIAAGLLVAVGATYAAINTMQVVDEGPLDQPQTSSTQAKVNGKATTGANAPAGSQASKEAASDKAASSTTASADSAASAADTAQQSSETPSFDVVRVEPSGDAVIAGRSEAGAIVALLSNGEVIGKAVANENGEFAIILDQPLAPGEHDVSLSATSENGEELASEQHIAVSVPQKQSEEVLVVLNEPETASTILQEPETTVAQPAAPQEAKPEPQVAAETAPTNDAPVKTGQAQADVRVKAVEAEQGKVYVAGDGTPGSKVRVYVDDELVGETKTEKDGRWLVEADKSVKDGEVDVRADQVASNEGQVEARAEVTFNKAKDQVILQPVKLAATGTGSTANGASANVNLGELPNVIIRRGDNLWTISRRLYGSGYRYTTIYRANDSQIRNPDLIYPGQVFVLPTRDENWTEQQLELDGAQSE